MKRDLQKYVVFKRDDTVRALSEDEIKTLAALNNKVNAYRLSTIRIPLQCVVVEEGWPMYEATWEAIETWVDHKALRKDLEDLKKNAGLL